MTDSYQDQPRVELSAVEQRVMGALIEKFFLTPDIYPMTTNALVTACNQKTNRDPVVSFTAVVIDSSLLDLRQRKLVRMVSQQGSRSTKHRHTLDEALGLGAAELAVLSVLLLRGPQTLGELRLRTERHHGFEDLASAQRCLDGLAGRSDPLVRQLPRQPGHKEARWQHLLADPDEVPGTELPKNDEVQSANAVPSQMLRRPAQAQPAVAPAVDTAPSPHPDQRLVDRVDELERQVSTLRRQLATLAEQLGESLE